MICENFKCPHNESGKCWFKRPTDVEKCKRRLDFLAGTYVVRRYKKEITEAEK